MDLEQNKNCGKEQQENIKFQKLKLWLKYIATFVISKEQRKQVYFGINKKTWMHLPTFIVLMTIFQLSIYTYYELQVFSLPANDQIMIQRNTHHFGITIWRLFTNALIYSGKYRLLKNMSIQILFGIPLEIAFSAMHIIPLYVGGILFTDIFLKAVWARWIDNIGYSSGAFALVFAQISNLVVNNKDIPFYFVQLFFISIYVISEFVENVYYNDGTPKIYCVYNLYIFAAVYGFIYGLCIICYKKKTSRWNTARVIILSIFFSCLAVAILKVYFGNYRKFFADPTPIFLQQNLA